MNDFLIDCSFKQYSMALKFDILIQRIIFVNFSANSKQNSKIFRGVHLWPRGNRLAKKLEVKNLVTLSL
jgi:hypothetical protein